MNEQHFKEIEVVMLYLGEARNRAEKAQKALTKMKAEPHLIEAVKRVEHELSETSRFFRHGTYFAAENYPDESVAEQLPLS
jgi:hypothetical protein